MSHTVSTRGARAPTQRTSRPPVTNNTHAQPQTMQRPAAGTTGMPTRPRGLNGQVATRQEKEPRTFEHRDGFAVLRPDTAKNDRVKMVAEKESQAYEKYKKEKRTSYTTTNAAVGFATGDSTRQTPLRPKPATSVQLVARASVPLNPEQHKQMQRQKAELNRQREAEKKAALDKDRREKNTAFLDRLQGKGS